MRRGLGNPRRTTSASFVQQRSVNLKERFAQWRSLMQEEGPRRFFSPLPSVKRERIRAYAEQQRYDADDAKKQAWYAWEAAQDNFSKSVDTEYQKEFMAWLMGKGLEEDHAKTPWGREPHALLLPEVRAWIEQMIDAASLVENYLAKLLFRGPQSLNEYALYYKYLLHMEEYLLVDDSWIMIDFPQLYNGGHLTNTPDGTIVGQPALPQRSSELGSMGAEGGRRLQAIRDLAGDRLGRFRQIRFLDDYRRASKEARKERERELRQQLDESEADLMDLVDLEDEQLAAEGERLHAEELAAEKRKAELLQEQIRRTDELQALNKAVRKEKRRLKREEQRLELARRQAALDAANKENAKKVADLEAAMALRQQEIDRLRAARVPLQEEPEPEEFAHIPEAAGFAKAVPPVSKIAPPPVAFSKRPPHPLPALPAPADMPPGSVTAVPPAPAPAPAPAPSPAPAPTPGMSAVAFEAALTQPGEDEQFIGQIAEFEKEVEGLQNLPVFEATQFLALPAPQQVVDVGDASHQIDNMISEYHQAVNNMDLDVQTTSFQFDALNQMFSLIQPVVENIEQALEQMDVDEPDPAAISLIEYQEHLQQQVDNIQAQISGIQAANAAVGPAPSTPEIEMTEAEKKEVRKALKSHRKQQERLRKTKLVREVPERDQSPEHAPAPAAAPVSPAASPAAPAQQPAQPQFSSQETEAIDREVRDALRQLEKSKKQKKLPGRDASPPPKIPAKPPKTQTPTPTPAQPAPPPAAASAPVAPKPTKPKPTGEENEAEEAWKKRDQTPPGQWDLKYGEVLRQLRPEDQTFLQTVAPEWTKSGGETRENWIRHLVIQATVLARGFNSLDEEKGTWTKANKKVVKLPETEEAIALLQRATTLKKKRQAQINALAEKLNLEHPKTPTGFLRLVATGKIVKEMDDILDKLNSY